MRLPEALSRSSRRPRGRKARRRSPGDGARAAARGSRGRRARAAAGRARRGRASCARRAVPPGDPRWRSPRRRSRRRARGSPGARSTSAGGPRRSRLAFAWVQRYGGIGRVPLTRTSPLTQSRMFDKRPKAYSPRPVAARPPARCLPPDRDWLRSAALACGRGPQPDGPWGRCSSECCHSPSSSTCSSSCPRSSIRPRSSWRSRLRGRRVPHPALDGEGERGVAGSDPGPAPWWPESDASSAPTRIGGCAYEPRSLHGWSWSAAPHRSLSGRSRASQTSGHAP